MLSLYRARQLPELALSEPNCTWRILQSHTDAIFDCESSLTALM